MRTDPTLKGDDYKIIEYIMKRVIGYVSKEEPKQSELYFTNTLPKANYLYMCINYIT